VRNPVKDWPHGNQQVVESRKVGPDAGPHPILGPRYQPDADPVHADVTDGADEVSIVQHNGGKAALEQVAGPPSAGVDEVGGTAVSFAHGAAKVVCVLGFRIKYTWLGIRQ